MSAHRKKSAKKRIRTGEFAVAAFLGLAVTAAPAVAVADTSDGSTAGPTVDKGNETNSTDTGGASGTNNPGTGLSTTPGSNAGDDAADDDIDDDGTDLDDDDDDGTDLDDDDDDDDDGTDIDDETDIDPGDVDGGDGDLGEGDLGEGGDMPPTTGTESGTGTGTVGAGTDVAEPPVDIAVVPEPTSAETDPVIVPEPVSSGLELQGNSNKLMSASQLSGSTPPALASALTDLVPKPPTIAAFAPFMGIVNAVASWIEGLLPPFPDDPILNGTQVAAGWVTTLFLGLQTTYAGGQPTLFTFGAYVLMTAAYQRYEKLATNHLPGQPILAAGPLPLTWKVTSHDPDGDPLVYTVGISGQPSNGLITMGLDGTFSFVPASLGDLANGTDVTFTVRVNDSLGFLAHPLTPDGNEAEFTVTFRYPGIGITNGAPVFETTPVITHTNSTTGVLTGTFKASDPNGDKLSFLGLGLLGNIDVDDTPAEDGVTYTFTYTPYNAHAAAGLNLTDLVTITASDSGLLTDVKTFLVSLANDVNQNPVATYQNTGGSSLLGTVTGQIVVTDDDSVHSYTPAVITTSKGGVLVSLLTGDYVYTASLAAREAASATGASDADKIDTFTVTVSDIHGGTTDVLVTVTIPTINIAPFGGAPSNTLGDSNGVVRGHITLVINTDGDPLSYSIKGADGSTTVKTSGGGILHLNADGSYVYVPRVNKDPVLGLDAPYVDSFTIVVSDGRGGTSDVLVPLGVLGATGPLKNVGVTKTDNGNGTVTVGVTLGAGNAGLFNFGVGAGPSKGNVAENADGTFTYTTSVTTHTDASDEFTIIGTIDGLSVTVATVEVEPTLPNNPPTGGIGTTSGTNTTFIDRGIVLGTPVTPATQNTSGKFNATDPDGDSVTFAGGIYESTKGGLVTVLANGGFNYTRTTYNDSHHKAAAVNATDADKFDTVTINVSDGWGGTTAVTFRIALATSNDDPSTSVSVGSADGLGVVRGSVKGSDGDDDPFTYSLINVGNPAGATSTSTYTAKGGVVQLKSDGTFVYIPTSSATGTDSFKVTVSDGHGGTVTATVNVPIVGASSTKAASPADKENGTLNISASNVGLLNYSKGSDGAKGTVVVNGDGSYTYTRNAGQGHSTTPNDSFTIIGTDINGKTVTLKVNVAPAIANAAPVGGSVTLTSSTLKDQAVLWNRQSTSGSIAASDGDNDAVTFTAVTDLDTNNGGSVTVNANGTFTYTIDKLKTSNYFHDAAKVNASGNTIADSFNVTINDAFGGSTVYKVNVAIYAQNDNPTISGGVRLFNTWTSVLASGTDGDSISVAVTKQPENGSASYSSGSLILSTSGVRGGNTIQLTATETGYWKVVDGVAQVGTLASTTRTFTV